MGTVINLDYRYNNKTAQLKTEGKWGKENHRWGRHASEEAINRHCLMLLVNLKMATQSELTLKQVKFKLWKS